MVSFVGRSSLRRRRRDAVLAFLGCGRQLKQSRWSSMASLRKSLVAVAIVGAWAGVGSALFLLVTPREEQVQVMLKGMPGLDSQSREEAAKTKQLVLATLQKAADTQENVTWRKNWISGGGGKSA
ncbi:ubiquinol-cytochrome-c reductase complex assembly factor 3 [Saccopteryx bilineata]|uniref:ubiquinol-cytochrome-c reductase complex assembly factor 3 n=1 Tax=Saccopteryx bilineata TaxID=59482 RepID=UPI00338DC321